MNQPATPAPLPPAPEGMINVIVDGTLVHVKKGSTVMQACTVAQKEIPHFCYHERLSIAGNCRMCLVEVEGMPKPIASCHWPAAEGMKVKTASPLTVEARKGTMELLLINHPLDCPICDQGGECALQDQAVAYGSDRTHYHEFKRAVDDKNIGSKIKTVMTRCIHCTRCVRFATEIAGVEEFGATGRGENMQIGTYVEQALQSELAGNMIDLCPVGALTSAPYAYTARPWELARVNGIDILDATGAPVTIDTRAGQVMRVQPREDASINEEWLTDAARFSYDALSANRLTAPKLKKGKVQYTVGWPEALAKLKDLFKAAAPQKTAGLLGDLQSAEDAAAFKAFLTQTVGTPHLDSRRPGSLQPAARAAYTTQPFAQFEQTDAVLLVGCNPRLEAPLLNVRLRRAALKRRVPVAAIGSRMDLTYPHQHLGEGLEALEKSKFTEALTSAQHAVIIVSSHVYARPDAMELMTKLQKLAAKTGASLNVLPATCGEVTALDMAVLPEEGGKPAAAILKAWQSGKLDVLLVHGDGHLAPADLKQATPHGTLVYLGTHASPIAALADVVLPAAAWTEKDGLYANAEGRVQESFAATKPPLHAKEDWKIYRALSGDLGQPLPFDTLSQLRALITQSHAAYAPQNRGLITAAPAHAFTTKGEVSHQPFTPAVTRYYLKNAYLRQSATMHRCQLENGAAKVKPTPVTPPTGSGPAFKNPAKLTPKTKKKAA